MKKKHFILVVLVVLVLLPVFADAQCAMCKASVESSQGQKNSVANNLNSGILYLMAMPYLLIGFIFRKNIASLWRNIRSKNGKEEEV